MVATCFIQPIDTTKTRIQILSGENKGVKYGPFGVGKEILAKEGYRGLYKGIDAALMR